MPRWPPVHRGDAFGSWWAVCTRRCAARRYCTTERRNTHVTERRAVLYQWHPWYDQLVFVHELIDKLGDAVFRCNLAGRRSDRHLEVLVWMFNRAACDQPLNFHPFGNGALVVDTPIGAGVGCGGEAFGECHCRTSTCRSLDTIFPSVSRLPAIC